MQNWCRLTFTFDCIWRRFHPLSNIVSRFSSSHFTTRLRAWKHNSAQQHSGHNKENLPRHGGFTSSHHCPHLSTGKQHHQLPVVIYYNHHQHISWSHSLEQLRSSHRHLSEGIDNVYIIVSQISFTVLSFHVMGHTSRCSTIFVNTNMARLRITHNTSTSVIIPLHLRCSSHQPVATSTSSSLLFDKTVLCEFMCILFSSTSIIWCVFVCYLGVFIYVCMHVEDYHILPYI